MKKLCCLLAGILLLCCGCAQSGDAAGYASDRHQYDAETRLEQKEDTENLNANALSSITVPPDKKFAHMTLSSDVILAGTVADDGITERGPIFDILPDGPETDFTTYHINVREVWQGECDEEQMRKPWRNSELQQNMITR